jgi:hypothetical protein
MATNLIIKELTQLLGMQTAIILLRRFSNRQFLVPTADKLHDLHPLALTIGLAPAQALCKRFGGTRIAMPTEVNGLMHARNKEIVRRFLVGESISSLHEDFGLDRAYIQKLIDRAGHRELRLSRSVTN